MAWIESHQELADHPKTKRAARALGVSLPTVIGHLHLLWYWALDYAQTGDLSQFDSADIADAAKWEGDAEAFVTALAECGPGDQPGFLESLDGKLVLHDWMDYAGKLIEQREEDRTRKREAREKKRKGGGSRKGVRRTSGGQPPDGGKTADVPNPTQQNPTEPNPTLPGEDAPAIPADVVDPVDAVKTEFERLLTWPVGWVSPRSQDPQGRAERATVKAMLEKAAGNVAEVAKRLHEGAVYDSASNGACKYISEAITGLKRKREAERASGKDEPRKGPERRALPTVDVPDDFEG
jgi:hypothetical protein